MSLLAPLAAMTQGAAAMTGGPLNLRPNFRYQVTYTEGLQSAPGLPRSTWIEQYSGGIRGTVARNTSENYTYTRSIYSSRAFQDSDSHDAAINGGFTPGDLRFDWGASYRTGNEVLIETAQQSETEVWTLNGSVGRSIGQKAGVQLQGSYSERTTEADDSSPFTNPGWEDWRLEGSFRYSFLPQLGGSLGLSRSYSFVKVGADMKSTRLNAQLTWTPGQRLSLSGGVGFGREDYDSGLVGNRSEPSYNVRISYRPTQTTNVSVEGRLSSSPSYFANQSSRTEAWSASISQRVFTRLQLSGSYSNQRSRYRSNLVDVVQRQHDSESLQFQASMPLLKRASLALSYRESWGNSDLAGYDFNTQATSFTFSYSF